MAAPLEYDFRVIGRAVVEREIASLEKRFIASAQRLNREFNKLATGGTGNARGGGSGGSRATGVHLPGHREYIAQQRLNHRQELRNIKEQERAAIKAVRAERQAQDNLNRSRQSIHNQRVREEKQTRAEHVKTNAIRQRDIDRQSRVQQSLARQRAGEERQARLATQSKVDFVKSTVGGGVGRVANLVGSVGRTGMAIAGIGAAGMAASSISQAISLDEGSRRLSIAGRREGQAGIDPALLSKEFIRTGIAHGTSPESVMEGVRAYVTATGDIKTAMANRAIFATTAQGGDASLPDIFKMGAAARQGLKIDKQADMKEAFATWFEQGREGKFELRDFATEGPEILQAAASMGYRGVKGARDIGTLANIGMIGNNSVAENSTALRNLFLDVRDKADGIQKGKYFGGKRIDIYKGGDFKNGLRDTKDWMFDMISTTGGDIGALGDVMQRRGIKMAQPLANEYMQAAQISREKSKAAGESKTVADVKANAAGNAAMGAMWDRFNKIPASFSEVERSAADAMKSFSVQIEILNTKLKEAIASQLFPEIVKLIPQLTALVPLVAKLVSGFLSLVSWLSDNPLKGIGIALAASIGLELVKARIGAVLATGLASILAGVQSGGIKGGLGAVLPTGGKTTLAGAMGAAGTGLAIGAAVAGTLYTGGIAKFEAGENSMAVGGSALQAVRGANTSDIKAVQEAIQEQRKRVNAAKNTDILDDTLGFFGASNKKVEANTQESYLSEMEKKLTDLQMQAAKETREAALAMKEAAVAQSGVRPNTGDGPSPIKPIGAGR